MGWLIELFIETIAEIFGYQIGRNRPWWVELVATLGCLVIVGAVALLMLWLLVG